MSLASIKDNGRINYCKCYNFNPLLFHGLLDYDKDCLFWIVTARRLNVNNHNSATSGRVPPNVWGSQTQEVIPHHIPPNIEPWYQQDHNNGADEESVSDVIDALRGRMNPLANSDLDSSESSDDDDRNDLM